MMRLAMAVARRMEKGRRKWAVGLGGFSLCELQSISPGKEFIEAIPLYYVVFY